MTINGQKKGPPDDLSELDPIFQGEDWAMPLAAVGEPRHLALDRSPNVTR